MEQLTHRTIEPEPTNIEGIYRLPRAHRFYIAYPEHLQEDDDKFAFATELMHRAYCVLSLPTHTTQEFSLILKSHNVCLENIANVEQVIRESGATLLNAITEEPELSDVA